MLKTLIHIAFLLLSGHRRALGIVFSDESIRLAVVNISFPVRSSFRPQLVTVATHSLPINGDINDPQLAVQLKSVLANEQARTAFVAIRSSGVRMAEATVPGTSSDDVGRWVSENHEKLHRLPVSLSVLAFASEVIGEEPTGLKIKTAFVRREQLEGVKDILSQSGIRVAGVEADEPGGVLVNPSAESSDGEGVIVDSFVDAQSVAARGLLGGQRQSGLLSPVELDLAETQTFKTLFQRTAFACGALLLTLLLAPLLFSLYVQSRHDDAEEMLNSVGPVYAEVRALETQVAELETQLSGPNNLIGRSRMAAILQKVAAASSNDLWFTKLTLTRPDEGAASVQIEGYARDGNAVTMFMKTLETGGLSRNVTLVRSGSTGQETRLVRVKLPSPTLIEFELKASIND